MSMYIKNGDDIEWQFASNKGYSDLIEAARQSPSLKMFFDAASADGKDVVHHVCEQLRALKAPRDVLNTAVGLADMIDGEDLVFITNGTHDDDAKEKAFGDDNYQPDDTNALPEEPEDADVDKFEIHGSVVKLADRTDHRHLVFGWFSIVSINGRTIEDTQGDMITSDTIENAAYEFILESRAAGEMHTPGTDGDIRTRGRIVESCVFTIEKQRAMIASLHAQGITAAVLDLGCVAWWGGFLIEDEGTWAKIVSGELKAFSIGGKGKRA